MSQHVPSIVMFIYLEGGNLQGVTKKNKYDARHDDQHHLLTIEVV